MRRVVNAALVGAVLVASLAAAGPRDDEGSATRLPEPIAPENGLFVGDEYRYGRHALVPGLALRIGMDLIAIPTGVGGWSAGDWAAAAAVVAVTVGLSIPIDGSSGDVRIQRAIIGELRGDTSPRVWTPYGDAIIWTSIWGMTGSLLAWGLLEGHPEATESAVLAIEAFAVTQVIHLLIKLATGRQGPKDGDGTGPYGGPASFFRYFPSGTPSGHVATMWAIVSAFTTYWRSPVLSAVLGGAAFALSALIVVDDYHFVSDTILGMGLGYAIGRWVVVHRSTRYTSRDDRVAWTVGPFALRGGGGLAAHGTF